MATSDPQRRALIVYAPSDEAFARGYLAPALGLRQTGGALGAEAMGTAAPEDPAGLALSSTELARLPVQLLEQLIRTSDAILPVLTPAFLADPWLLLSEALASHGATSGRGGVVPLVLQDCQVPLHLEATVSLDFRLQDDWDDEVQRLRVHLDQPAPAEPVVPCPYPGMRPFQAADAGAFHGREDEIGELVGQLTGGVRELYVIGPSGSGKSSLVAAGVVPRLLAQAGAADAAGATGALLVRSLRPGSSPGSALTAALLGPGDRPGDRPSDRPSAAPAPASGEAATEAAVAALLLRHPGAQLLVIIDQLEELFTQCDAASQRQFAAALRALRGQPRCTLLFTVRADFFAELLQSDLWLEGSKQHLGLSPLRGAALKHAIERPALQLGVYFEPGLSDRLLGDASNEPGALPLLQETLVHLWSRRRQRLLTIADYQAMGADHRSGLATALATRADKILQALPPARAVIARRVLLRLVSFGEGRPNTRRRQLRAALRAGEPAAELAAVLEALASSRLIVLDRGAVDGVDPDDDSVDLCHDVLLTAWPAFAGWVEARRADEQRRRQIQASADDWRARGGGSAGVLDAGELAIALAWRETDAARELGESPEVTALIGASRDALEAARHRKLRRVRLAVAGLALSAAISTTLAVLAVLQWREAERQRIFALQERARTEQALHQTDVLLTRQYQEEGRRLVVEGHPQQAIPYLVAAREHGGDNRDLRILFRAATRASVLQAMRHGARLSALSSSEDAQKVLSTGSDGTVRLWDARTSQGVTLEHAPGATYAELSPAGTVALTLGKDHAVRLWDLSKNPPTARGLPHPDRIGSAHFGAGGSRVVTACDDGNVRMWSLTGEPLGAPLHHDRAVTGAYGSPDGKLVFATMKGFAGGVMWDLTKTPPTPTPFGQAVGPPISQVAFSPDSSLFILLDQTSELVRLRQLGAPHGGRVLTLPGPAQELAFAPRGAQFAASTGAHVWLWDLSHQDSRPRELPHPGEVTGVRFSDDGKRVATMCRDKVTRVWSVDTGQVLLAIESELDTIAARLSPDGSRLIAADLEGVVRVWEVPAPVPPVTLELDDGGRDLAYSPDGRTLATASSSGLKQWDATTAKLTYEIPIRLLPWRLRFSRDSHYLANLSLTNDLLVWDVVAQKQVLYAPGKDRPSDIYGRAFEPFDFSPDGQRIAAALTNGLVQIWDLPSGRQVECARVHDGQVTTVRFSPDGRSVLSASEDGVAQLCDAQNGQPRGEQLGDAREGIDDAAFSADGTRIVTAGMNGTSRVWDAASQQRVAELRTTERVFSAVFSPDGKKIATYSADKTARLWDAASGRLLVPPLLHDDWVYELAFSPDGSLLATVSDGYARLWDAETGGPLTAPFSPLPLDRPIDPASMTDQQAVRNAQIRRLAFRPDGQVLATISTGGTVRIWDLGSDERSLAEWQHINELNSFAPLPPVTERPPPPPVTERPPLTRPAAPSLPPR